ncbi:hypothetical protein [Leptospira fluminis]|nr:hypothetical protein [Leptospira fluminis]
MEIRYRMGKIKFIGFAFLCISVFANCAKKHDNKDQETIAALLLLTSGNCAQTQKIAANSYMSTLTPVPSSSCNQATIFGTDPNSTQAIGVSQLKATLAIAQGISGCTNTSNYIQNLINSAAPVNQTTWNSLVAGMQWTPLSSIVTEGMASVTKTWPSLTPSQLASIGTASVSQYQTFAYETMISVYASAASEASCTAAVLAKINADFPNTQFLWSTTTPTAAAPTLISIACTYGSARNTAIGQCATLNNLF